MTTTEAFLSDVRDLILAHALTNGTVTEDECATLRHAKLVYGSGYGTNARGVTFYGAWTNGHGPSALVEVCAVAQESWVQLAGTLLHELGHVLAGHEAGHRVEWKDVCKRLGFRIRPAAAGQTYWLAMFEPSLREAIYERARSVSDGTPAFAMAGSMVPRTGKRVNGPRPCSAGNGTRGGTSRGTGSGSRMVKLACPEDGYTVRTTRKWIDVGLPSCPAGHVLAET